MPNGVTIIRLVLDSHGRPQVKEKRKRKCVKKHGKLIWVKKTWECEKLRKLIYFCNKYTL